MILKRLASDCAISNKNNILSIIRCIHTTVSMMNVRGLAYSE